MSTLPLQHSQAVPTWSLPSRGRVGMAALITTESAMFTIFVVAYIYYLGRDQYGPTPRQVLHLPVFNTVCLLSSSFFIWLAERSIEHGKLAAFRLWWGVTLLLGAVFLLGTASEWHQLITRDHLTISTNLFGTTFYSLVGLHAFHVIVGLLLLLIVWVLSFAARLGPQHSQRVQVLALYWHLVDAVWVVVFTVVYIVGR